MLERTVRVVNHLGLHARAAAQLVKLSRCFNSRITLHRSDGSAEADTRSILDVLALAAPLNTTLLLRADGPDEGKAIEAAADLFEAGFGEL